MKELEVLSPAGSIDSFFSAINNGADAVYLGLSKFNARAKSQDFTVKNIRQYVQIAHLFGVKVYVTLNTIVTQGEFKEVIDLVKHATEAKVDAFIVQDLGVAKLLKESFKNIVLHASTQMGIHNLEGALVAKELGFTRVVLSRETTLEDIKEIRKNTDLEIEYFVQGALCVAFSGACYFSSLKHSKSGNRGECLQLCRLCYEARAKNLNKRGYLLSTSDLCFVGNLHTLINAGVTSFKIEGRLRRPSYVAVATHEYAMAIKKLVDDGVLKDSKKTANKTEILYNESSCLEKNNCFLSDNNKDKETTVFNSKQRLQKVFFRGDYNNGLYLQGEPSSKIINSQYQNHRGLLIGKVINVKPFKDIFEIIIQTNGYQICKNDGLKFVGASFDEISLGVGSVKVDAKTKNRFIVYSKAQPNAGEDVYLTVDSKWEESLLNIKRRLLFNAVFEGRAGKPPILTLKCGQVEVKEVLEEAICQQAKTQGLTLEELKANLQKTQDTYFCLKNIKANMEEVFLPKSCLNELRRRALSKLYEQVVKRFEEDFCQNVDFDEKRCDDLIKLSKTNACGSQNPSQNFIVVNEQTALQHLNNLSANKLLSAGNLPNVSIVLSPSVFNAKNILNLYSSWQAKGATSFYLDLPRVLSYENKQVLRDILKDLPKEIGLVANNIYALYYSKERSVIGGASLNIANNLSALALNNLNVKTFVKSFESFASSFDKGISFEGNVALMTFCHCPYKTCCGNTSCKECRFDDSLKYISKDKSQYNIRRIKLKTCIFELVDCNKITGADKAKFIDLR